MRLTFLGCCNSDSSEKYPLMIIGNALQHRPFNVKYRHELGSDYYANKKASMTIFFFAWLGRFGRYTSRTPGRRALLFTYSCSAHRSSDLLPDLQKCRRPGRPSEYKQTI